MHFLPTFALLVAVFLYANGLAAAGASSAQPTVQQPQPQEAAPLTSTNTDLSTTTLQVRLLEAQLLQSREFQAAILDTVYWALGSVFVVVGLLLGFGWLANFRVYDRDKQALQADLDARFRVAQQELTTELALQTRNLVTAADESSEQLSLQFQHLREHLQEQLHGQVESSLREKLRAVEISIANLQRDQLRQAISLERNPTLALNLAQRLLYMTTQNRPREVSDVVAIMLKLMDEGDRPPTQELKMLRSTIDRIPSEHVAFAERFRERPVALALS
ncbi:MAG: hypothetical protein ACXWTT_07645 [Methylobacter sp.]